MFSGGFRRSSRFGLVGVLVVMALVAVIGLTMGSGEANPKLALGLIFGVLAVFFVLLFALQRSDLERIAESPAAMSEQALWTELAVEPIGREAIQARGQMWDAGRHSMHLGMVVTLLIFLTVPPIYFFESFVPLLIGGPLIAIAAIYGSVRALAPGGELDSGYEQVGLAMAPLGLEVTERPQVSIEMRDPVTPRMGPKIRGELVLSGERHGRRVSIRLGGGGSEVTVAAPCHPFAAKSKRVSVSSGPEGVVVTRKGGEQGDWLCDLWLAEQLLAD
ncbi:MAG TPA: hypothetical protein VFY75_08830 [Solirubrobacterales bacterium]|nr:hypothetical protein [Solirubrobacterales bacterium]